MYRILLGRPATAFVFLSGLMVSVATSAAAQIAFAEKIATNRNHVLASGALAFVAGVFWFLLSENIAAAVRDVDSLAPALKSREAAVESLPRRLQIMGSSCFVLACTFSVVWPWPSQLSWLFHWAYDHLATLL